MSNKKPPLPFNKISFGPVGQLLEMINFFNDKASNNTLGNPSYLDDSMNNSVCFSSGNGLSTKSIIFINWFKLFLNTYSESSLCSLPRPIITASNLIVSLI